MKSRKFVLQTIAESPKASPSGPAPTGKPALGGVVGAAVPVVWQGYVPALAPPVNNVEVSNPHATGGDVVGLGATLTPGPDYVADVSGDVVTYLHGGEG